MGGGFKLMTVFEIIQTLQKDFIRDELIDNNEVSLGYVKNEKLAISFCEENEHCTYREVPLCKYKHELYSNLIDEDDPSDSIPLTIAVKNIE